MHGDSRVAVGLSPVLQYYCTVAILCSVALFTGNCAVVYLATLLCCAIGSAHNSHFARATRNAMHILPNHYHVSTHCTTTDVPQCILVIIARVRWRVLHNAIPCSLTRARTARTHCTPVCCTYKHACRPIMAIVVARKMVTLVHG